MYLTKLTDGSYRFDTASGKEITLTEFELLGLFQLAAPYQDQLKAQREGHKHYPAATARVAEIVLGLESHHTEVIVRFVYAQGGEKAYVISPEDAESMRDGLTNKLEKIAAAKRGRTKN